MSSTAVRRRPRPRTKSFEIIADGKKALTEFLSAARKGVLLKVETDDVEATGYAVSEDKTNLVLALVTSVRRRADHEVIRVAKSRIVRRARLS